jgi:hypothetical protein
MFPASTEGSVVTVGNISLSDVSLQAMTVNTTVNIFNPNPVGACIRKVAFDVWYLDATPYYFGHGEQSCILVKENDIPRSLSRSGLAPSRQRRVLDRWSGRNRS